jgi:hypothetical protein
MRDLVVREGLETMARDAAKRLRELIAAGEEIPYEVLEPGAGSPLCEYQPLTERFVRDHAGELRELDSFGATCAALETSDLAGAYLDEMGITVPEDPRRRAELAGIAFLCRLWMGSSDFSLDADRLSAAIAELETNNDLAVGEVEVAVPLRGFQMPTSRLDLAGVTIVVADGVDVPAEARASEGLGGSPWEPTFLAVARIPEPGEDDASPDAGVAAVQTFRRLITTLRLFKSGGVTLGPHAWTRASGDRWRRISTGSGRPRPGGYRVTESEVPALAAFSRALAGPSTPFGRSLNGRPGLPVALGRAISRFEAGLERVSAVEALNDHLLALRFVLEGGGPANLGLAMRVAALCAEPSGRDQVKAVVDRAAGLERELWSGEPAPGRGEVSPAETATMLEELTRAILKDAACGHLGSDLRVTADEILLADGLAVGDGAAEQRGATEEWSLGEEPELAEELDAISDVIDDLVAPEEPADASEPAPDSTARPPEPERQPELWLDVDELEEGWATGSRITPRPDSQGEEEMAIVRNEPAQVQGQERTAHPEADTTTLEAIEGGRESSAERGIPSQSPVLRLIEQTRAERKAHHERIAGLFPRAETTEWSVRELSYDRSRRAEVS